MSRKKKKTIPIIVFPFIIISTLTIVFAFLKLTASNTQYIYVKVKVSQGFWWAATVKPNLWIAKSIKKGDSEYNLLGQPIAEVLEVRHYPYFPENQPYENKYNIYFTLKIGVDYNKRTQKVIFKRSTLSVGSPIELDFPSTQITGTVIELSSKPFEDKYIEKVAYLTKRFALPWEFDAIKIGDTYFDGEDVVFKVLSKTRRNTTVISMDSYGNISPNNLEPNNYITVKAIVRAKSKNGQLFFGEEKVLNPGSPLAISTPNFRFENFVISKIE